MFLNPSLPSPTEMMLLQESLSISRRYLQLVTFFVPIFFLAAPVSAQSPPVKSVEPDVVTSKTSLIGQSRLRGAAFSPDRSLMAGAANTSVILQETSSQHRIGALSGHTEPVNTIAFSPNGFTLASA